ncbi:hypothetical protein ACFTSF_19895 [Kribbella sp. NPDC056951]|uniref:hypothetical protein n=1 Tax=Kribbella sp. NPDC056951 TaxID=3345978 RepID=UPI0036423142
MNEHPERRVMEQITVSVDGVETVCPLERRMAGDSQWTLTLTAPDGATYTGAGQGLWTAFVALWHETGHRGFKLCCAGARIDANMRRGRWANSATVEILSRRTLLGIHHTASVFDDAPVGKVGTVEEQTAYYGRWLATPWWKAFLPGDPVR